MMKVIIISLLIIISFSLGAITGYKSNDCGDDVSTVQIPKYGLGNIVNLPILQKNVEYEFNENIYLLDIEIVDETKIISYLSTYPEIKFKSLDEFNNMIFNHLTYYLTIHKLDMVAGYKGLIDILGVEVTYKS